MLSLSLGPLTGGSHRMRFGMTAVWFTPERAPSVNPAPVFSKASGPISATEADSKSLNSQAPLLVAARALSERCT